MKEIKFYGSRNDNFVMDCGDNFHKKRPNSYYEIRHQGRGVRVYGLYDLGKTDCWSIALEPLDEDVVIEDWPIEMTMYKNGYSTLLTICTPNDAVIV